MANEMICSCCGEEILSKGPMLNTNLGSGTSEMKKQYFCNPMCMLEWIDRVDGPPSENSLQ